MDFLSIFKQALLNNSKEDAQQVLGQVPTTEHFLELILDTERYEFLSLFTSVIGVNNIPTVAKIMVKILNANSEEAASLLDNCDITLRDRIIEAMCLYSGEQGLPAPYDIHTVFNNHNTKFEYEYGLVKSDLFELASMEDPYIADVAGYYCSINCMEKAGYGRKAVTEYFRGALAAGNKRTLDHLRNKADLNELYNEILSEEVDPRYDSGLAEETLEFALQEGIVITEANWDWIKREKSELYARLQEQV